MKEFGVGARIAIVIPWFGRELRGGAELQAWNLAARLTARGYSVEVLTTCCRSFHHDWAENHHPPGLAYEPEGFTINRFPVEPRDRVKFDQVCGHLLTLKIETLKPGISPIPADDERVFREHLIRSPSLLAHLGNNGRRYSAFIFLPYLYGPILDGLPIVASRALLQPCLHDEAYAYLDCVQEAVFAASRILWLSAGEYELGLRLFGPAIISKSVVGMAGVEAIAKNQETTNPGLAVGLKPFVLLLGRKDKGKGTFLAVEAFRAYRSGRNPGLQLVIAGPGEEVFSEPGNGIHDLGLVTEETRLWLLKNAVALLQPSPNESFSRVLFEAWQSGRPVVARRSCLATARAVQESQGGWLAETVLEWSSVLSHLDSLPQVELEAAGRRGAEYAAEVANWERVLDRYDQVLRPFVHKQRAALRIRMGLSVLKAQRLELFIGGEKLRAWDLFPGDLLESGWIEHDVVGLEPILELRSDESGYSYPPDSRKLGFRLEYIDLEFAGSAISHARFCRGWNRSEAELGTSGPRWSTGSALISVPLANKPAILRQIHQVLPNLGYGDAIGNHAIWLRDKLQEFGYVSEIFARHIAPEMLHQAYPMRCPESLPDDATVVYHHSIGSEVTPWVCEHPGPKALIYHNITPAEFYAPYRLDFAEICRRGRDELPRLAPFFRTSVGDSRFNADELGACGFEAPSVLPLCVDPSHWNTPPDPGVMAELQDGCTNILFVGRIVPNKRHEELIYTLKFWLEDDPTARLYLVGTAEVSSFYLECLKELAVRLRVDHAVRFVGHISDSQLHAYYRCATMFWCFSEHEGFCVPLIEAMWFDIPVVAFDCTAVGETMGGAGILFCGKEELHTLPQAIRERLGNEEDRLHLIRGQRERRTAFLPPSIELQLQQFMGRIDA